MSITLKSARINKGLTQVEAAKLIGVTKDTLSNYERGKSYPDVPIIKKIEQVYGVTYSEIKFLPWYYDLIVFTRRWEGADANNNRASR